MARRMVVFIKQGRWGDSTQSDTDWSVDTLLRVLSIEPSDKLELQIFDTLDEARSVFDSVEPITVVFFSRGMAATAAKLKRERSHFKVMVVTGLIPDDQIVWVEKQWLHRRDTARHLLLDLV